MRLLKVLEDIDYDDMGVVFLLAHGVKIIGNLKRTGIWKPDQDKLAKIDAKQLWTNAREAQRKVMISRPSKDPKLDKKVWDITKEEAESGQIEGPLSQEELESKVGRLWIAARRFGTQQGEKIRPIDNFSEFQVNAAFGTEERIHLLSVDHVVAWTKAWIDSTGEDGRFFEVVDTLGDTWEGALHPSWSSDEWKTVVGRVTDLKNAYKQIAVSPAHACFSVVAVLDTDDSKMKLFKATSLMFGETAAVYSFLRISRALAAIAARLFSLVVVEFFDDFSQIESVATAVSAMDTIEGFLSLLGWEVAVSNKKRLPFSDALVSLGVQIEFKQTKSRVVVLKNKPGRIVAICKDIDEVRL